MKERLIGAFRRARYAAIGAAIGAFLGGLVSRNGASTGGATGALLGALVGEKRHDISGVFEEMGSDDTEKGDDEGRLSQLRESATDD
ncbi:YMGG-like Gly-zipper [Halovenus aranensis]|uniref:YMGG-like Gly-zipper n=1 Tax=Halovenus aranensis TaxID=890420 RepID=A0A1G8WK61_9EURY|nr:glycine zipper 2TM domain-containing protein [Halovenus aranensis]SDJ78739.1 YMGG-like Gly-zipper [Halovenus aranensis]